MDTNGLSVLILLISALALYGVFKKACDEFTKSIAKPCDEIASGARDARRCAHAVAGETKKFLAVQENRDKLKRAVAVILILGIAEALQGSTKKDPKRIPERKLRRG